MRNINGGIAVRGKHDLRSLYCALMYTTKPYCYMTYIKAVNALLNHTAEGYSTDLHYINLEIIDLD